MLIFWHPTENLRIDLSRILITFSDFVTSVSELEHSLHSFLESANQRREKCLTERKRHGQIKWRTDKLIVPFLNRNIHNKIEMHIYTFMLNSRPMSFTWLEDKKFASSTLHCQKCCLTYVKKPQCYTYVPN